MVRRQEKKYKKYLGSRRWGGGRKGGRRGKGVRGGVGRAGGHKHKWTYYVKYEPEHFGKRGFVPIRKKEKEVVSVGRIAGLAHSGKLEKKEVKYLFEFDGKVLAGGKIDLPVVVKATAISESAKKKIESAGGEVRSG